MTISLKTHKMLWGLSGSRCAFTDCGAALVETLDGVGSSLVGEEAHIVARERLGPRGHGDVAAEQLDQFDNLILLCRMHHKIVDDHPEHYSAEVLRAMKRDHEAKVLAREQAESRRRRLDAETCASYVDVWVSALDLENWTRWTSGLFAGPDPFLERSRFEALDQHRSWLLSRVWPKPNHGLERAFVNFRAVLDDLILLLDGSFVDPDAELLQVRRFYKIDEWNPKRYHRLLDAYRKYVANIENLTFELTRAANYICDIVRACLDPRFRLAQGAFLVERGPYLDSPWEMARPEYGPTERDAMPVPYPGLTAFAKREGPARDFWVRDQSI